MAYEERRPVGCGALRHLEPGVGEIRHVRVAPEARRPGLAEAHPQRPRFLRRF
ncbi:GNAT family N-acetyltransferase [Streptomyces sp. NPDC020192]|uniref:GNAT family N-acetyltransferase n=1 Tax=Streptomyces sp. NPDC020192 TaxID=3365066 RepID=UPI0037B53BA5